MSRRRYDWHAADRHLVAAQGDVFRARRNHAYLRRVSILKDIDAAMSALAAARLALQPAEAEPSSGDKP